ncbi:hypothetical protein ACFQ46_11260 [Kineococcus sp. GCM10028916]|uniref:hypothetical protein n=1 Tax=unclassified Kineococcus TaxID=2621656 RepID=UPI002E2465E3
MTLFVSFFVILLVAAVVGRVCSSSRPGDRPGVEPDRVHLPDTGHHSGWAHAQDRRRD